MPYVEWAGIYTISAVLGRHIFSQNARGTTFPNVYVLMVGPPGTGKSEAEDLIRPMLRDMGVKLSAQHVSKASLIDELNSAKIQKIIRDGSESGKLIDYHGLAIVTSEFIETFPDYDVRFLGMLARWWDCPPHIREVKRHLKDPIDIYNVSCSILAGVQPGILAHAFPAEAWNGGFLSRTIFVYVSTKIELLLYTQGRPSEVAFGKKIDSARYAALMRDLEKIGSMVGQMTQDEGYIDTYLKWRAQDQKPKPRHPKLTYYNLRREHQLEKLSMISAASRGSMVMSDVDYGRALSWLQATEANSEDIFVEMASGDDLMLMKDMHAYIIRMAKGTRKPIRESIIQRYLTGRIASQRMESFLTVAEGAGFIKISLMASGPRMISAEPLDEAFDG